jgi:hypothetical protein
MTREVRVAVLLLESRPATDGAGELEKYPMLIMTGRFPVLRRQEIAYAAAMSMEEEEGAALDFVEVRTLVREGL